MSQSFIGCDREQAFLLPPSLLEWLPPGHLAWTILDSVAELDLSAFYAAYRRDGHGRPAYEPAMMVALLLYAYTRGNRSSRGIERACVEDVAYRVIATNLVPDHSTIAEFRRRHETALADLFTGVLSLCREAELVTVGVIAVDGTKVHSNSSHNNNLDFERLTRAILVEAERIDREEDEQHGEKRGDELPEQLQTVEGRRAALRDAKQRLERQHAEQDGELDSDQEQRAEHQSQPMTVKLELDPAAINEAGGGRRRWLAEGRHQLNEQRKQQAQPIPRSRRERLLETERRMQENLAGERAANEAYEHYRATGRDKHGRRLSRPPDPYQPPQEPDGMINTSDPDSRNMQTAKGWVQGYNAQAAVNEHQIIVAAEITVESPDFGHLQGIVEAAEAELKSAGVPDRIEVLLADAGYWHQQQMEKIVSRGTNVLIPPDADKSKAPRRGWEDGPYAFMRAVLAGERGGELYRKRQVLIEPVFGDIKHNRKINMFLRRGRSAVRSEWRLITTTHNLLKLHKHQIATAGA